jgi:OPA family glycerol-3-phosphate transporter-like MFS transporter
LTATRPLEATKEARRLAIHQATVIVLLFLGYASYYFCRSDLSVAMPMLAEELKHSGMNGDMAVIRLGSIVSLGVVAYAVGKFLLAGLGDVWGGRFSFLGGLSGALFFTVLFATGGGLPLFTIAWVGNRLVQSMGWAGSVKVCSQWFSYRAYGTVVGILSLSFLIGDAVAREWMALLIARGYGWRSLFWLAAIFSGTVLAANLLFLKEKRTQLGFSEPEANPLNLFEKRTVVHGGLRALLLPFLRNREFWLVCFLSLCTTIVRETFNSWTPTYLHKFFGYSESASASASAVFPALGAVSVVIAGIVGDRLGVSGRSIVLFFGMTLTTVGLSLMTSLTAGTKGALPLTLIGLVGLGLLGPYSYLAGAMALDLGGKQGGATSSGLIDGIGYAGGILAGDSVARVSVHYGWSGVFVALAAISAAAAAASGLLFVQQQWHAANSKFGTTGGG